MATYKPRSIQIFLLDGEPDGVRTASITLSTVLAVALSSSQIARVAQEFPNTRGPGVYIRLGANDDGKKTAYVGQSGNVVERLKYWATTCPDTWSDASAFVSKDGTVTTAHAEFVEAVLIQAAKENLQWVVDGNKQQPSPAGRLPKPDEFTMLEFIEQAKTLAGALGCDLFRTSGVKPKQSSLFDAVTPDAESADTEFHMAGATYDATAIVLAATGRMWVQSGSSIRAEPTATLPKGVAKLRDMLLADGVLKEDAGAVTFTDAWEFSSTSAAACLVSGTSTSGPQAWKTTVSPTRTYGEWLAEKNQAA